MTENICDAPGHFSAVLDARLGNCDRSGLVVEPGEIYFGTLIVGESDFTPRTITVTNRGTGTIGILGVEIVVGGAFFTLSNGLGYPDILRAGDSFELGVRASLVGTSGRVAGLLEIRTNEARMTYRIGLSGRTVSGSSWDSALSAIYEDFSALVQQETWSRASGDYAEAGYRLSLESRLSDDIYARVTQEQIARVNAVSAEAISRNLLEAQLSDAITAGFEAEQYVRATLFDAEALARTTLETSIRGDYNSKITNEQSARVDAFAATAYDIQQLSVSFTQGFNDTGVRIDDEISARVTAISSEADRVNSLLTELTRSTGTIDSRILASVVTQTAARSDAIAAEASRVDTLLASYATSGTVNTLINAAITTEQYVRSTADESLAGRVDSLEAIAIGSGSGAIDTYARAQILNEAEVRADAIEAEAIARGTLSARVDTKGRTFIGPTVVGTPQLYDRWYDGTREYWWTGTSWDPIVDERVLSNQSRVTTVEADLITESEARADADEAEVINRVNLAASVTILGGVVTQGDTTNANAIIQTNANLATELIVRADEDEALSRAITELSISVGGLTGSITTTAILAGNANDAATAAGIAAGYATSDAEAAAILANNADGKADIAFTNAGEAASAANAASIAAGIADGKAVVAGGVASGAQGTANTALAKINASYTVRLNVNGFVSGFGLANDGAQSSFAILADRFSIVDPNSGPGATPQTVFEIVNGLTRIRNLVIGFGNVGWGNLNLGELGRTTAAAYVGVSTSTSFGQTVTYPFIAAPLGVCQPSGVISLTIDVLYSVLGLPEGEYRRNRYDSQIYVMAVDAEGHPFVINVPLVPLYYGQDYQETRYQTTVNIPVYATLPFNPVFRFYIYRGVINEEEYDAEFGQTIITRSVTPSIRSASIVARWTFI